MPAVSSSTKYDVIVIGGGHNGLTNAAYLAKAGKKVLVLERRHVLGGAACTEEVFPGFKFSVCSYVVSLLRPEIIRDLDLPRHGLEILPLDGTFTPMPNGDHLWRVNDHGKTHREIARHSRVDAEAYDEFGKAMQAMCRFVKPILSMIPPDPATLNPRELMKLVFIGRRFQGMSSEDKYNQVQLMTMSAIDFLDQWFETDVLKATMSASGIIGTFLGVRSPGTAYVLLHHYMGEIDGAFRAWGFARGGTGAISNAIADAAREAGAEIRTEAAIAKILVKNGRATGVVLANGDEIYADVVSSSVDPRLTFTKMIEPGNLPDEFMDGVRRYKFRGSSGKVNMALDGLPNFKCMPGVGAHLRGAMSISPSVEYMEKAYDEAKYGHWSSHPYIDMVNPTLTDTSLAPPSLPALATVFPLIVLEMIFVAVVFGPAMVSFAMQVQKNPDAANALTAEAPRNKRRDTFRITDYRHGGSLVERPRSLPRRDSSRRFCCGWAANPGCSRPFRRLFGRACLPV